MRFASIIVGVLTACGGSSPKPEHGGSGSGTGSAVDPGCVYDDAANHACDAKGAGFSYGPQPYIYCSGVPPRPGEEEAERERIRKSPCTCNDAAEIAKQRQECSKVP